MQVQIRVEALDSADPDPVAAAQIEHTPSLGRAGQVDLQPLADLVRRVLEAMVGVESVGGLAGFLR